MPFGSLLVQRDRWDTYWGAKKDIIIRGRRCPHGPWRPDRLNPVHPWPGGLPGVVLGRNYTCLSPTAHAPPLRGIIGQFSRHSKPPEHELLGNGFQSSRRAPGCRIDGVCGAGDSPPPDLPPEASRSRSAPEKSVQFGPDGAPFPSKTPITRGPPVVAVAVSLDPILPQR